MPLGYIATRLERHQGHSARSPAAHLDEFIYSGQATQLVNQISSSANRVQQLATTSSTFSHRPCNLKYQIIQFKSADGGQPLKLTSSTKNRSRSLKYKFNSCKSADGGQPLKLTSSTKNRSRSLKYQFNSCKSADGGQPLKLTSSAKKQAMQPRNQFDSGKSTDGALRLTLTSSPFYSGHVAHTSNQLKRTAHTASAAQFEELSCSTHARNSDHTIHKEKREMHQQRHKQ